ncbi:MAG: (2Fe-2S) ferredoxin domain-containing protein [Planctomycetota bacterium]|jgi:NADP-reducing hydrogenase subunit HndB
MAKLRPEDLGKIAEKMRRTTALRDGAARARVTVHMGTCGISAGARPIMTALMAAVDEHNVDDVVLTTSGCAGLCSREPMLTVEIKDEAPVKYVDLTAEKATRIFAEHILKGAIVSEFALGIGSERMP